ncbi:ras-related protein RABC2a-like isoform X2 [Corylus avellana]|uniref:ras-related protein RABC2a-like isoform X2 n=1 Tax=Corylus avellana TaxID=13451 RepID=UPI001E212DDC|nr:ras-related protein RABC2a-like isoform X2 [Corylus avellana]
MDSSSFQSSGDYSHSFKIILIGDAGVGKTSLISSFVSDSIEPPQSTDDMDLKFKLLTVGDTKLMLKIWDTVGQDKFRTLTQSFYRGADGIILVYDITDRSSFTAISDFWAKEVGTNNPDCVMMFVGNKVDRDSERVVSQEEGTALAKGLECSFFETSAKTKENVKQCFETLALQIMELSGDFEEEEEEEEVEEEFPGERNDIGLNMDIQVNMDVGGGGGGGRGRRRSGSYNRGRGRSLGRSRGRGRSLGRGRGRLGGRGIRGGRVIRSVLRVPVRGGRC